MPLPAPSARLSIFVTFHAKGRTAVVDGHVQMRISKNAGDAAQGFAMVSSYPKFRNLPDRDQRVGSGRMRRMLCNLLSAETITATTRSMLPTKRP